jgi:HEXXH motif-containing protein
MSVNPVNLSPASFVVAGESAAPTRLLRQASGVRVMQKCLPLIAYLSSQHSNTPYGPVAQAFLEQETDLFDDLTWSPVFRSWFSDARHMPDWETLTPQHEALLKEFCSLILRPTQVQDYLKDMPVKLAQGGRYCPPELDWCWIAEDPTREAVMPASLAQAAEAAASLEEGESAEVKTDDCAGRVYKPIRLGGETWITNLHPRLKVYLSGTNQREDGTQHEKVDWDSYPDAWDVDAYLAPYELMATVWPEEFADHLETLKVVVPMNIPKQYEGRSKTMSFTVSSHQGAVFLTTSHKPGMLEMLLHEKAHVKLRYVEDIWPLLEAEQTAERFKVPWRPDPRPVIGIFEGIYVFLQVAIGLSRCQQMGLHNVKKRATELFSYLEAGLDIIGNHARMTPEGQEHYATVCEVFNEAREEFMESQVGAYA